ncbi:MAG: LPS export ABC transporter periplasmic protein LptC [Desulfobacterium sp.]|nr:LPS export ABC transporter periplasmic protein LptC [Desulfobacterium sp.]
MRTEKITPKRARLILVLILLAIVAALGGFYFKQRLFSGKLVIENIAIDSGASLIINKMHQTSTRNSVKEWTLDATSARLLKNENKALMNDVRVVFFTGRAEEILLESARGVLDTETHDMTFTDNVVVTFNTYKLKTGELHYDKKRHIVYSSVHVKLMDNNSTLEADTMETDLNDSTVRLRGNVKGRFSETSDFFSGMGGGF